MRSDSEEPVFSGEKGHVTKVTHAIGSIEILEFQPCTRTVCGSQVIFKPLLILSDIELDGMNLEIADAAYQAGFDTANHHALFDLIYAVRRIGLRGSLSQKPLPPRHKIYPDRYRPSGYGDNTCRKRKRSDNIPSPVLDSSRRNSELDRCRRKEKKGLRNFAVKIEHASKRGKTADDPISVESDPGTEQSAKRPRKQYSGGKGREFEPQGNTVDRVRNGSDLSQPTGFAQIKSPCFTASLDNLPNSADPNSRGDSVLVQNIDRVKYGMRDTYERMSYCMILMEEAFEKSGNLFFENDTMQILRLLSDIITSIKKDAKLGHKKIEHIRGYVLESHRGD